MKPIYLDYNATTPIDPEVAAAMRPFLEEHFGNPSSAHWYGAQAKKALENARRQVAQLLNSQPEEIIFTSGGSESNNLAIKGEAFAYRNKGNHIITSQIEHPAAAEVCKYLEENGFRVTRLAVDEFGLVDPAAVENAITAQTILITIMHANNEIGTIQPIEEIGRIARAHNILFHTDAAQSVGKIPARVDELGVDLLSVAGHKLYAPKGIGALFVRKGVRLQKQVHGADHEQNRRAGTENVLLAVGLGKACEIAGRDLEKNAAHMREMRDRLFHHLKENLPHIKLNGHPEKRLPNTLSLGFPNLEANTLLAELEDVAASAGAACHSDSVDVSATLAAMKVALPYAMGTVRFSTGKMTGAGEIDRAAEIVIAAVRRLQPSSETPAAPLLPAEGVKLTHFTHGLGCACKLRPQALEKILQQLPPSTDPNVLVGTATSDDAAVYRLGEQTAIVQTVDFFTPIVDDPYQFGAIAAANSLSDIYAMGARPLFALNIVAFPSSRLPMEVLRQILRGAQDKAAEAGISIIGGHTIDDSEPKFGLAVSGIVDPRRIWTNAAARPGDALILTKPLGTGIIATAMKRGLAEAETARLAIRTMSELNRAAAETLSRFTVHACTDVTGFGLLGHLLEMARGSGVSAVVQASAIPLIAGARELAAAGVAPGGTLNNLDFVSPHARWSEALAHTDKILLCDAQTSGGLLVSVPEKEAAELVQTLHRAGVTAAAEVGKFQKGAPGMMIVKG